MYWDEHGPPHFHAALGDDKAVIGILETVVLRGHLPRRALGHIFEWSELHRRELLENWYLCATGQAPRKIPPLD
jgi:hypothetical protein